RLTTNRPIQAALARLGVRTGQGRLVPHSPAPALLAALALHLVHDLACRDGHQQAPEAIPVIEPREPALLGAPAKAVEGAESDVLLVERPPGLRTEIRAGQAYELMEIALPEPLGGD